MNPVPGNPKLTDPENLVKLIRENPEKKFILTGGVFDILQPAHIDLIDFASKQGDVLIAAVREEGAYTPLEERLEILSELEKIDFLITFSGIYAGDLLPGLCHKIVAGDEFQLAGGGTPYSDKTVIYPL